MMPLLTRDTPWFAFLTHPRSIADILAHGAGPFIRHFSCDEAEFVEKVCTLPPVVVGDVRFGFSPVHGEVISIMRMPADVMTPAGKQAIVEGALLAARRGAAVLSLGALTAPATGGGQRLLRVLPSTVTVTNGNAYTAAVVLRNVEEAATFVGLGRKAKVAVVGCTGSVGAAASLLLMEDGYDLILIGRTAERVRHEFKRLEGRAVMSGHFQAVQLADIIVLLTNDTSAQLAPGNVKRGAVVIDCAQPPNIPASARPGFDLKDVSIVTGGLVIIPEYTCSYDFGLADGTATFACLTEAYLFAREGLREHSVGKPSGDLALRLERMAQRYGIRPSPLAFKHRRSFKEGA